MLNRLLAWSFDTALLAAAQAVTAGRVYLVRVPVDEDIVVSNVHVYVATAGAGLTSGRCLAAVFNDDQVAPAKLQETASQHTAWQSVGAKVMPLGAAQALIGGRDRFCYVALLAGGTTPPAFARSPDAGGWSGLVNLTAGSHRLRFGISGTGQTVMPASVPVSGWVAGPPVWVGLS